MLESKEYIAIQDFSMGLDNGKNQIYVKRGETLEFDGLNVKFRGDTGTVRSLAKVIGEWIIPTNKKVELSKVAPQNKLARPSRNATGGKAIEHSDYPSDPDVGIKNSPSDSIETLLKNYEQTSPTKLVNGKREVTSDLDDIKREVTIIHDEENIVRKVSAINEAVTNKNSVELGKTEERSSAILSTDGDIAKETNYSGKEVEPTERKKLVIDYEASGVEVSKVSNNKASVVKTAENTKVFKNEEEVGKTSYPSTQTTDVGSSTQAQVEKNKTPNKSDAKKKAPVKKKAPAVKTASRAPTVLKGPIVDADGQEAVIISKVRHSESSYVESTDGITSRVTIGATGDMDVGEVQFSSSGEFEEPGVTIGNSGVETSLDMIDPSILGDDAEIIEDSSYNTGVVAVEGDIDLNSLLSEI